AYVLLAREPINRRIEPDPSQTGQKSFHPSVRRTICSGMSIFGAVVEITADISAGDTSIPDHRNHDMRKILTHSLPGTKSIFDRRIDGGAFLHITECVIDAGIYILQERQRAALFSFVDADLLRQLLKRWRRAREMAGHKHVPIVFSLNQIF